MLENSFPQLPEVDALPDFGLYMDQVMTLMEKQFPKWPLTKTMINNYTKDKILFPTEKKKYSREHLMMLSLIQILKRTLTLPQIKTLLSPLSKELEKGDTTNLYTLYEAFLSRYESTLTYASNLSASVAADSEHKESLVYLYALLSSYFQNLAEEQAESSKSLL